MRRVLSLGYLALLCAGAAAASTVRAPARVSAVAQGIRWAIEPRPEGYVLREPIMVTVVATNTRTDTVRFLYGSDNFNGVALTVSDPDDRLVKDVHVPSGPMYSIPTVTLAPGQTLRLPVVLNTFMPFDIPGVYSVRWKATLVRGRSGLRHPEETLPGTPLDLSKEVVGGEFQFVIHPPDAKRLTARCREFTDTILRELGPGRVQPDNGEFWANRVAALGALSYVQDDAVIPFVEEICTKHNDFGRFVLPALRRTGTPAAVEALKRLGRPYDLGILNGEYPYCTPIG